MGPDFARLRDLQSVVTFYRVLLRGAAILLGATLLERSVAVADPTFAAGVSQGTVSFPELTEASGIIASHNNRNVLWTHNDSGDLPRIFAIDTQGRKLGIYNLTGATHVDYEDIALGPGPIPGVSYIYVGDIGDNTSVRTNVQVYQIPEPAVYARQFASPLTINTKGVRRINLTYPDGAHDAEALFVDPMTGDLFIAIKHSNTSKIYTATKAQLESGNSIPLSLVGSVAFDVVSAAD